MHSVYALCDPRTGDIRYIGRAVDIHRRYAQHLLYSSERKKKAWLEELKQVGLMPTLIILEANILDVNIAEREMHWIGFYLKRGDNLTNAVMPNPMRKLAVPRRQTKTKIPVRQPEKKADTTNPARIYTIVDAANRFRVSVPTIIRYINSGELPSHRDGSEWLMTEEDIKIFWQHLIDKTEQEIDAKRQRKEITSVSRAGQLVHRKL